MVILLMTGITQTVPRVAQGIAEIFDGALFQPKYRKLIYNVLIMYHITHQSLFIKKREAIM